MEAPSDSADGAALCAYQYFENVRNFLMGLQDLGLPTFEASDLEKVTLPLSFSRRLLVTFLFLLNSSTLKLLAQFTDVIL